MLEHFKLHKFITFGSLISVGFYISLFIGLFLKLYNVNTLSHFDRRIISASTMAAVNVDSRISFYFLALISVVLISLIIFYLIYICQQNLTKLFNNRYFDFNIKFFNIISFFGFISFLNLGLKISISVIISLHFVIILLTILKGIAYIKSWKTIQYLLSSNKFVIWFFLSAFSLMFDIEYVFKKKPLFNYSPFIYILSFFIIIVSSYVFLLILTHRKKISLHNASKIIILSTFPLTITPSLLPISNETFLILNQQGIFNISPLKIQAILFILILSVSFVLFVLAYIGKFNERKVCLKGILENLYYPGFLIMFAMILYQPAVKMGPPSELFESGNPGLAIDQLFRYGRIPILETFNAHAFSELLSPLVFSILNGYQGWAGNLYSEVIDKIFYYLIAYFFLKRLFSKELAVILLLFFPVGILTNFVLPNYYIISLISVFGILKLIKAKYSFQGYLIFWFILSLTFMWRFDLGSAAIMSALGVIISCVVIYRNKFNISKFVFSGMLIFIFWFSLFLLIAFLKHIPVIFRLKELFSVISSNQVWGYPTIGDSGQIKYYLYYYLVPILNLAMFLFIIYKNKFVNKVKQEVFVSIIFMVLFSILNFPRGLVRHSLVENNTVMILGFLTFCLSYFLYLFSKINKLEKYLLFSIVAIGISLIVASGSQKINKSDNSLIVQTMKSMPSSFVNYKVEKTKIARYEESQEYSVTTYSSLKKFFDETMAPDETFIDFSNSPYLYVYTQRRTPMYINQTPVFLSDEISQLSFLEEIKSSSIPYVIFADKGGWTNLDGVPNNIRSYRVAEYIYKNYEPLVKMNGLGVWVLHTRKNELENKLNKLNEPFQVTTLFDSNRSWDKNYVIDDLNATISENTIKLVTGSKDPQLYGIIGASKQQEVLLREGDYNNLEMIYTSQKGGNLQIFYQIDNFQFNEQFSTKVHIDQTSVPTIVNLPIPFNGLLKDIRIDPPSDDVFNINNLSIKTRDSSQVINENYQLPLDESVDISWLPYYWGSKDSLEATSRTKVLSTLVGNEMIIQSGSNSFKINNNLQKSNGNYLYLRLKSNEIRDPYKMIVKYNGLTNVGMSNTSISFLIKADGQYHDYLIRVSSQFNWHRTSIDVFNLDPEAATTIESINIREGD
ncbi:hypothetical protein HQN90_11225 [Paenibacillus alba]|uniref:hypothetical protein n=1 Tax=Paenibacillus alba TaxID=1197127 RepID=UPI001563ABE1|nr:hypothetical protein [Paenibacillus alba]NQX66697.1 hypothetical protein [Paenibacillus alba]